MHIRRDNDIRPPCSSRSRPCQHFGDDCQLGIGFTASLSINGKGRCRYQRFGHNGEMRFPTARELPHR